MRASYKFITGDEPSPAPLLNLTDVRGMDGVKEASVEIGGHTINVAVCHGGKNIRDFLNELKESGKTYDFIEMMACPGGCIGGGGQPRAKLPVANKVKGERIEGLYNWDSNMKLRSSYENPEIKDAYANFLEKPLGHIAHELLHTTYVDRSGDLGARKDVTPETCPTSPKFKKPE